MKRIIAFALMLLGCSAAPDGDARLTVGVASSAAPVVREITAYYVDRHPGLYIEVTVASSGTIIQQLSGGAPIDIFILASHKSALIAHETTGSKGKVQKVAGNALYLAGRDQGALERIIAGGDGLIAIGNPAHVPLGVYTKSAFEKMELWEKVLDNAVVGDSASQVREYLRRGEVDAAVIYSSDLRLAGPGAALILELAPETPPSYYAGQANGKVLSQDFLEFLDTEEARAFFRKHGFTMVGGIDEPVS